MDAEMFTNGGADNYEGGGFSIPNPLSYGPPKIDGAVVTKETAAYAVQVGTIKLMHATKVFLRAITLLAVVYLIVMIFCKWIPESIQAYKGYTTDKFSQKENLQWLGASTDIVRGDYENNQDSLAERSMKTDARITDISQPAAPQGTKLTFLSRERYMTPEEELMKKQQM